MRVATSPHRQLLCTCDTVETESRSDAKAGRNGGAPQRGVNAWLRTAGGEALAPCQPCLNV